MCIKPTAVDTQVIMHLLHLLVSLAIGKTFIQPVCPWYSFRFVNWGSRVSYKVTKLKVAVMRNPLFYPQPSLLRISTAPDSNKTGIASCSFVCFVFSPGLCFASKHSIGFIAQWFNALLGQIGVSRKERAGEKVVFIFVSTYLGMCVCSVSLNTPFFIVEISH